jgi:hypothetical protein
MFAWPAICNTRFDCIQFERMLILHFLIGLRLLRLAQIHPEEISWL